MVNVVGPDHRPREFLEQVILLVRAFCRGKDSDAVWPVSVPDCAQPVSRVLQHKIPGSDRKRFTAPFAEQWLLEAIGRVQEVVAKSTLHAEIAVVDFVIETTIAAENGVILDEQVDLAADSAIWAGCVDNTIGL
jgi:hypothetical protein